MILKVPDYYSFILFNRIAKTSSCLEVGLIISKHWVYPYEQQYNNYNH